MSSTQIEQKSDAEIEKRFQSLRAEWQESWGPTSSAVEMAMHPAYQQIIGIGPAVIPCLVQALREQPDH